jgi:hypothetical protein
MSLLKKTAVCACFTCVLALGADTEQYQTGGLTNRRFWAMMPQLSRMMFVTACCEGYIKAMATAQYAVREDEVATKHVNAGNEIASLSYINYGEVTEQVERLYKDPANRGLPIIEMVAVSLKKFKGESDAEISQELEIVRRIYVTSASDSPAVVKH